MWTPESDKTGWLSSPTSRAKLRVAMSWVRGGASTCTYEAASNDAAANSGKLTTGKHRHTLHLAAAKGPEITPALGTAAVALLARDVGKTRGPTCNLGAKLYDDQAQVRIEM